MSFRYGNDGDRVICPNCDPNWELMIISKRFSDRYCYKNVGHINDANYVIVEPHPDKSGWISVYPIGDTHLAYTRMSYEREILEPRWQSYQLGCGCETITPSNLEETLERWQRKQ